MPACDTSDNDTASDTEEEEEDAGVQPTYSRRSRRFAHTNFGEPPARNPNLYSRNVHERTREVTNFIRNAYTRAPMRSEDSQESERNASDSSGAIIGALGIFEDDMQALDQELRDARAILERLTQREDIGDDFWASVGLTRPAADRVERLQRL